ncbi:MAG TPA: hypothetical protein VHM89_03815 [Acidimicrobiales bacterium]|nr:hypothetical protein [Acidimicrobiales bacterium]
MSGRDSQQGRERLVAILRTQVADAQCWERAETAVRAGALRDRLAEIGVAVTPDVAASLMAAAMLLASSRDEWGGDYRDALADIAALGLELFDGAGELPS